MKAVENSRNMAILVIILALLSPHRNIALLQVLVAVNTCMECIELAKINRKNTE